MNGRWVSRGERNQFRRRPNLAGEVPAAAGRGAGLRLPESDPHRRSPRRHCLRRQPSQPGLREALAGRPAKKRRWGRGLSDWLPTATRVSEPLDQPKPYKDSSESDHRASAREVSAKFPSPCSSEKPRLVRKTRASRKGNSKAMSQPISGKVQSPRRDPPDHLAPPHHRKTRRGGMGSSVKPPPRSC